MHSLTLALFAAGALAGNLNHLVPRELQVRQDQSFTPTTDFGQGATCADAFGAGYIDCNGVCYNPTQGETCCSGNGDAYPCPSFSFCLVNGLCCPDGLPAETCAAQNGVSLPEDFSTNNGTSVGQSTAQTLKPTVSVVESSASSSEVFVPSTTAVVATPYPVPGNSSTAPGASGTAAPTGTGAGAGPAVAPFTGGAAAVRVVCGGLMAGLAGVVAMLL